MDLIIKELKDIKEVLLCKVNKKVIAQIPTSCIIMQSRNIDDIDEVELLIKEKYTSPHNKQEQFNIYYDDVVNERYICVDGEYFVIKNVDEDKIKRQKTVKAFGQEKKLEKINVTLSNIGLSLLDEDKENNIYSFDNYLYEQTGWRLNHVDSSVRYMSNGEPKVRMQEDTDTSFYLFITEIIRDQFCCIPIFNRTNKTIDLYNDEAFGDELKIVLSKDNYLKNLIKTSDSNDIVTRLRLRGNEEKCVVEDVTPTGFDYIEDYSYFVQTKEMSQELIDALMLFEKLASDRQKEWKELTIKKVELDTKNSSLNANETITQNMITQIETIIKGYDSLETDETAYDLEDLKSKVLQYQEELLELNKEIAKIEDELEVVNNRIEVLNKMLRRETSEDMRGKLIFTEDLLSELKEFTYYDTYTDDSFINAEELIKTGKRELERRCKPTVSFDIDSINFMGKLLTNDFRKQWDGSMGLGDVIGLYDKDRRTEEFLYFVGWEAQYENGVSKNLTLKFSNKKTQRSNSKIISDLLNTAKNNNKIIKTNKYLWNKQKYNKVDGSSIILSDFKFEVPTIIKKNKVTSVKLDTSFLNLNKSENYLLSVIFEPQNASNKNVKWVTSDKTVATVENGLVTAISKGGCTISVISEDGNHTYSIPVSVGGHIFNKVDVTGIRNDTTKLSLNINEERFLVSTVIPLDATEKGVTYSTTDKKVAIVNEKGLVTAIGEGDCRITTTSNDNADVQCSCFITVSNKALTIPIINIKNALVIGGKRMSILNGLNYISSKNKLISKDLTPKIINSENKLDAYKSSNPNCIITMFGIEDSSVSGQSEYKTLLTNLQNTFPSKPIFIINELGYGVAFDEELDSYKIKNINIQTYNESMSAFAKGKNMVSLNCNSKIVIDGLLNANYTDNGIDLNNNGAKLLYNNIESEIKKYIDSLSPEDEDGGTPSTPPIDSKTHYVITSSLNVRELPNSTSKILGTLSLNTEVKVLNTDSNGWCQINFNNKKAYVSGKYLSTNKPNTDSGGDGGSLNSKRDKITSRAKDIVQLCKDGKAWYSQYNRTIDYNKKQTIKSSYETVGGKSYKQPGKGKWGFDCSSFVGCCYQNAGYDFMKGLSCSGGSLQSVAKKHGAKAWRYTGASSLEKAKPGDIIMWANYSLSSSSNLFTVSTHHTAIYMGNGYVAEAKGYSSGIANAKRSLDSKTFFIRIKELEEVDSSDTPSNTPSGSKDSTNCYDEKGTIDGHKYVYKFTNARCTCYGGNASASASGTKMSYGKSCAGHNMPYGTKIYFPSLKGKYGNSSGIYTVHDTGGYCFDFDLYLASSDSKASSMMSSPLYTTGYVISWGDGRVASSFTDMVKVCKKYYNLSSFHSAWVAYMKHGGCTINFWKFNDDDKTFKDNSWYKSL